jgi:hypothetical protein
MEDYGGGMSKKDQLALETELKKIRRVIDLLLTPVKEKEHAQRLKSMLENVPTSILFVCSPLRFVHWI